MLFLFSSFSRILKHLPDDPRTSLHPHLCPFTLTFPIQVRCDNKCMRWRYRSPLLPPSRFL